MFNNLVESSSHRSEFRRRGSFFLFTTASYALFFVIAGIVSIYAYDARMEDQNLEIVTMMPLVDLTTPEQPAATASPSRPNASRNSDSQTNYSQRRIAMAAVDQPEIAPAKISTTPNPSLPMPKGGVFVRIGGPDSDPGPGKSQPGNGRLAQSNATIIIPNIGTPPPAPVQAPVPKVLRKAIINGEALSLPKPPYPEMAKQLKIQGMVSIQVLIDESGQVVSAKAVSGNHFLVREAQKAAYQARFSPTLLRDQPVKVSGVITYNFVLQQ